MKYLSLQQAMLGMRAIMTDDGLILKSPAGSAHYDLKGRRRTVWGDASFFPEHFRVKDKRKPNLSRVVFEKDCTTFYGADGKEKVRIGNWDNLKESKGFRIHANSPLTVNHGQAFIDNALIGNSIKSTNFNVRIDVADKGKSYAAGMKIGVEQEPVTEARPGDQMIDDVLNSIRSSDLCKSLQADLQQVMHDTVSTAIRNAMKPGGVIWAGLKGR